MLAWRPLGVLARGCTRGCWFAVGRSWVMRLKAGQGPLMQLTALHRAYRDAWLDVDRDVACASITCPMARVHHGALLHVSAISVAAGGLISRVRPVGMLLVLLVTSDLGKLSLDGRDPSL